MKVQVYKNPETKRVWCLLPMNSVKGTEYSNFFVSAESLRELKKFVTQPFENKGVITALEFTRRGSKEEVTIMDLGNGSPASAERDMIPTLSRWLNLERHTEQIEIPLNFRV